MTTVHSKRPTRYSHLHGLVLSVLLLAPISYGHARGLFCPTGDEVNILIYNLLLIAN